eukprot:gene15751-21874_t
MVASAYFKPSHNVVAESEVAQTKLTVELKRHAEPLPQLKPSAQPAQLSMGTQSLVRNWRFPSSRKYLWDRSPCGPPQYVQPKEHVPDVEVHPGLLQAVLIGREQQAPASKKQPLNLLVRCTSEDGSRLKITLQPAATYRQAGLSDSDHGALPCSISDESSAAMDVEGAQAENRSTPNLQHVLQAALDRRGSTLLSQLYAGSCHLSIREEGRSTAASLKGTLLLSGSPLVLTPLFGKRLCDVPLAHSLAQPCTQQPNSSLQVYSVPLVGVWVRGASTGVVHPMVLAACLRFAYSAGLPDRALQPDNSFLMLLFPPEGGPAPSCFECRFLPDSTQASSIQLLRYSFKGDLSLQSSHPLLLAPSCEEGAQPLLLSAPWDKPRAASSPSGPHKSGVGTALVAHNQLEGGSTATAYRGGETPSATHPGSRFGGSTARDRAARLLAAAPDPGDMSNLGNGMPGSHRYFTSPSKSMKLSYMIGGSPQQGQPGAGPPRADTFATPGAGIGSNGFCASRLHPGVGPARAVISATPGGGTGPHGLPDSRAQPPSTSQYERYKAGSQLYPAGPSSISPPHTAMAQFKPSQESQMVQFKPGQQAQGEAQMLLDEGFSPPPAPRATAPTPTPFHERTAHRIEPAHPGGSHAPGQQPHVLPLQPLYNPLGNVSGGHTGVGGTSTADPRKAWSHPSQAIVSQAPASHSPPAPVCERTGRGTAGANESTRTAGSGWLIPGLPTDTLALQQEVLALRQQVKYLQSQLEVMVQSNQAPHRAAEASPTEARRISPNRVDAPKQQEQHQQQHSTNSPSKYGAGARVGTGTSVGAQEGGGKAHTQLLSCTSATKTGQQGGHSVAGKGSVGGGVWSGVGGSSGFTSPHPLVARKHRSSTQSDDDGDGSIVSIDSDEGDSPRPVRQVRVSPKHVALASGMFGLSTSYPTPTKVASKELGVVPSGEIVRTTYVPLDDDDEDASDSENDLALMQKYDVGRDASCIWHWRRSTESQTSAKLRKQAASGTGAEGPHGPGQGACDLDRVLMDLDRGLVTWTGSSWTWTGGS